MKIETKNKIENFFGDWSWKKNFTDAINKFFKIYLTILPSESWEFSRYVFFTVMDQVILIESWDFFFVLIYEFYFRDED